MKQTSREWTFRVETVKTQKYTLYNTVFIHKKKIIFVK